MTYRPAKKSKKSTILFPTVLGRAAATSSHTLDRRSRSLSDESNSNRSGQHPQLNSVGLLLYVDRTASSRSLLTPRGFLHAERRRSALEHGRCSDPFECECRGPRRPPPASLRADFSRKVNRRQRSLQRSFYHIRRFVLGGRRRCRSGRRRKVAPG